MNQTPQKKKSSPFMRYLPWVILVVVVATLLIWNNLLDRRAAAPPPVTPEDAADASPDAVEFDPADAFSRLERGWLDATGSPPDWPESFTRPGDCEEVVTDLEALCARLDTRGYVQAHETPGGACGLLYESSRALEARRPTVSGETRRLDLLLGNVAHMFRALGEDRLRQLAEMIALEPDLAEPMAMALYRWTVARDLCAKDDPRGMNLAARYDYAAFLVQTLGGQAYLRRRAPRLEALGSLYAVLILDQAIEAGHNPEGIDLGPELARARALVDTQDLLFRDRYLALLEDVDRRWTARTGGP